MKTRAMNSTTDNTTSTDMRRRIDGIDFIKAIMILLMIAFHLVFIGDTYPYAKQIVYTFHMPAFLVISGYMLNTDKSARRYLISLLWIFIPYAVMEGGYTFMASILPIREHIDNLTLAVFAEKILLHPLGPYWYLHTLMLCHPALVLCHYGGLHSFLLRSHSISLGIDSVLTFYL